MDLYLAPAVSPAIPATEESSALVNRANRFYLSWVFGLAFCAAAWSIAATAALSLFG